MHVVMQAMSKLKEPKIVLKVRKADMSLVKENLDSIKSKFKKVCSAVPLLSAKQRVVTLDGGSATWL